MAKLWVIRMLVLVGAVALSTGVLQEAGLEAVRSAAADRPAAASPVLGRSTQVGHAAVVPLRTPAVLRFGRPRPGVPFHMTFPRTWRPVKLEVGSPLPPPPLRTFCATCPPGTVLEVDL